MKGFIGRMLAPAAVAPPEAEVQGLYEGTFKDVPFEAKRVQRQPPAMGKPAPAGAIVLLDGKTSAN